jgi:hypothetical protein
VQAIVPIDALVARVSPLARVSEVWLTWLLQGTGVLLLLALGAIISSTMTWVLLAIPMTVLVLLFLAGLEGTRARSTWPAGRT